jgi:hypothetical protein
VSDEDDSDEIAGSDGGDGDYNAADESDGIVDDGEDGDSWMRDSDEEAPVASRRSRGRSGKVMCRNGIFRKRQLELN